MVEVGALRLHTEGYPVPVLMDGDELLHVLALRPDGGCVEVAQHLVLCEDNLCQGGINTCSGLYGYCNIGIGVGHAARCIPDAEGHFLAHVVTLVVVAIDVHCHVGGSAHLLGRCHASALAIDERSHHALRVLHQDAADIHLSDNRHVVVVLRRVNGPLRFLAAYLHHDAQRFQNAVVAQQTDGHVVVAHGHQRVHLEAQRLRFQRLHVIRAFAVDEREPLRHII